MGKEATLTRTGIADFFFTLGKYCLSTLRGAALVSGGIGSLVIIGAWILVLVFPIFLLVSFILKLLGF